MSEQEKDPGAPDYKGWGERLLYDPRVFMGATSALALAVLVAWGVRGNRASRSEPAPLPETAAQAQARRGFFAPPKVLSSELASARATAVPAEASMVRRGAGGTAIGVASSAEPVRSIRELTGKTLEGTPAAGAAVPATTGASLDERIQEAIRDHEKEEPKVPEADGPIEGKPPLRPLDRFTNSGFVPTGGAGGGASAPGAAAPQAPEGKPVLQATGATSSARAARTRAFFRPSAGTRALPSPGAQSLFSGSTLKGSGEAGAPASRAASGGRGERLSMVGGPTSAAETLPAMASVNRGGGGGGTSTGGSSEKEVKPATKAHILAEADKRRALAERYKAAVVLPLVKAEWSEAAFPQLQEQTRQAEVRLRGLDSALIAALPRFGDRPDVVAAFNELHLMLSGDGRDDIGGNMAGRLRMSQDRITSGLQDVALLPVGCSYAVQVLQPRAGNPSFPRAAVQDLPALGVGLIPAGSSTHPQQRIWGGTIDYADDCVGLRQANNCASGVLSSESVHDSARSAHKELDYAARQSYNVRVQALTASEAVPQQLAPLEAALRRTDPVRADELRALGARARADLSGAAALLPDPPALSRALGLSAVGAAAEAARGEVRALRDALNGEYRSYPDTRNRQNASLATNESFDGAQGAANTLAGYPGAAGQPLKGLVQSGEESVRTLVGLCDAYHSMYALAGDVK
ncbi:MAG: hypothetical protein WC969_01990 [Elusimicrobiota bacterium]|jgi:hypothetical protein